MELLEKKLKALADKNRLRVLAFLYQKKLCVCELAELLEITQPSVSKHLKKLKEAGIIDSEQDGFWTNYFIDKNFIIEQKIFKPLLESLFLLPEIKIKSRQIKSLERENLCCKK